MRKTKAERTTMADVVVPNKGVGKKHRQHWLTPYLERLDSPRGMSAKEIFDEEAVRREKSGGRRMMVFKSVERTLNEFGYPHYGTVREKRNAHATAELVKVGQLLKRLRKGVVELQGLMPVAGLSPAEQEFCYLWIEAYPDEVIADLMDLGDAGVKAVREKFKL